MKVLTWKWKFLSNRKLNTFHSPLRLKLAHVYNGERDRPNAHDVMEDDFEFYNAFTYLGVNSRVKLVTLTWAYARCWSTINLPIIGRISLSNSLFWKPFIKKQLHDYKDLGDLELNKSKVEYRSAFDEKVYFINAEFLVPLESEILEVIYLFQWYSDRFSQISIHYGKCCYSITVKTTLKMARYVFSKNWAVVCLTSLFCAQLFCAQYE